VSPVKVKGKQKAAGGGKKADVNNESEYRTVLETFVHDLCVVLDAPEWPVASMSFLVTCRALSMVLEDASPGRSAAARQVALDMLGNLVARLRQREVSVKDCGAIADVVARFPHVEVKDMDQDSHFAALAEVHRGILSFLVIEGKKDFSTRSAETYILTDWIARLLANASSLDANGASRVTSGSVVRRMFTDLLQKLCAHARYVFATTFLFGEILTSALRRL
jgi:hypothetical protein